MPRAAFDFVDGGADDEITLRRNGSAFDDLALVPRVLRGVSEVSAKTTLFGRRLDLPVLLSPIGGADFAATPDAYTAAAAAAADAGTVSVLAWAKNDQIDAAGRGHWLQVYLNKDRALISDSVERAKIGGVGALVLTADVPVAGNRERDGRNGLTIPLRIVTPKIAVDVARRPVWLWHHLTRGRKSRTVATGGVGGRVRELRSVADGVRAGINPRQTWDDLRWLREVWEGPLLLKGVMCAEDATLAIDAGCEGVIVSNHGGRQLDGTPASIEMLPEVVAAVNGRAPVLLDGGVRRGTDVVKALSLGAHACLVGRPWVFAAAAGGQAAIAQMLDEFHTEILRTLQLLGAADIDELGPHFVRRRAGSHWHMGAPH